MVRENLCFHRQLFASMSESRPGPFTATQEHELQGLSSGHRSSAAVFRGVAGGVTGASRAA
jgi:hypothetical protein